MSRAATAGPVVLPAGAVARGSVIAPPSKSHAIRVLICAALAGDPALDADPDADPTAVVCGRGPLPDDVEAAAAALRATGLGVAVRPCGRILDVRPSHGRVPAGPATADVGGSGTALRLLAGITALGPGPVTLTGNAQLLRRPAGAIVPALRALGVAVSWRLADDGVVRPPIVVSGGPPAGGDVEADAAESSHVVSALLLAAPLMRDGLVVRAAGDVASRPYIDLTVDVMREFGARVRVEEPGRWTVDGAARGGYRIRDRVEVEGDWSSAAFLLATAAATGGDVTVTSLHSRTHQADARILALLGAFGAATAAAADSARCTGLAVRPVEADLRDAPDLAPLVGALACLVPGTTRVRGAAHLRLKETDRIAEVVRCARALGCEAVEHADGFDVRGPATRPATIDPAGDHRLAMAFAVAGLAVPGTRVADAACVAKSYPAFWDDLGALAVG